MLKSTLDGFQSFGSMTTQIFVWSNIYGCQCPSAGMAKTPALTLLKNPVYYIKLAQSTSLASENWLATAVHVCLK